MKAITRSGNYGYTVLCALGVAIAASAADAEENTQTDYEVSRNVLIEATAGVRQLYTCHDAVDLMLSKYQDRVKLRMLAAKTEWLCGRMTSAISILQDAREKHKDVMVSNLCSFELASSLWIGTISRHCGDMHTATDTYNRVLQLSTGKESLAVTRVWCHLYQAEIAEQRADRREEPVVALREIRRIAAPESQGAREWWGLYQEWADYEIAVRTDGVDVSRKKLVGDAQRTVKCGYIVYSLSKWNGIIAEPITSFYDDGGVLFRRALDLALECRTSLIDRALAQYQLGIIAAQNKDLPGAEKYYGDLLASDSFFAPEGGVRLAQFQKEMGKNEDALKTLAKVKERFPGYAPYVAELSKGLTAK